MEKYKLYLDNKTSGLILASDGEYVTNGHWVIPIERYKSDFTGNKKTDDMIAKGEKFVMTMNTKGKAEYSNENIPAIGEMIPKYLKKHEGRISELSVWRENHCPMRLVEFKGDVLIIDDYYVEIVAFGNSYIALDADNDAVAIVSVENGIFMGVVMLFAVNDEFERKIKNELKIMAKLAGIEPAKPKLEPEAAIDESTDAGKAEMARLDAINEEREAEAKANGCAKPPPLVLS